MSLASCLNSAGLVADIVGVVLIWCFGIPEPISRRGAQYLTTGMTDDKVRAKAERLDRLSKAGLGLIVIGFVLQLVSNILR
jgi:hypothetical protein